MKKHIWIIGGICLLLLVSVVSAKVIDIGGKRITIPTFATPISYPPPGGWSGKIGIPTTTTLPDSKVLDLQKQIDDLKSSNSLLQSSLNLLNTNLDSANGEIMKLTDQLKQRDEELCKVNKEYKFCS